MFVHHENLGRVALGFTDRADGVSEGPWESLNLGTSNGDAPERVAQNLQIVGDGLGVQRGRLVRMSQHHTADVALVDAGIAERGDVLVADALVTSTPGVGLLVRVADCVPVVLADADRQVIGVAHAGRTGVALGVVPATVEAMRAQGAATLRAWVGPRACGRCYEVPAAMREEIAAVVPETWAQTSWGTPALDLAAGVVAQLRACGAEAVDLAESRSVCTIEDTRYFSYRRQGQRSGRFGAVVQVRP